MTTCRNCGQQVTFKSHPQNPEKLAPFDADGKIHFAKCRPGKPKKSYASISDIGKCFCSMEYSKIRIGIIQNPTEDRKDRERLYVICPKGHRRPIHITPENMRLMNDTPFILARESGA